MLSTRRPSDKYDLHYCLRDRGWYLKLDRENWFRATAEEVRERLGPELNRTPSARYPWYDESIPDIGDRELATKIGPTICRAFREGRPIYGSPRA
jgi:hypothetical protein